MTLIKRFMERVHLGKICEEVKGAQWGRGRMWSPWKMHFSLIPLGALEYKLYCRVRLTWRQRGWHFAPYVSQSPIKF